MLLTVKLLAVGFLLAISAFWANVYYVAYTLLQDQGFRYRMWLGIIAVMFFTTYCIVLLRRLVKILRTKRKQEERFQFPVIGDYTDHYDEFWR